METLTPKPQIGYTSNRLRQNVASFLAKHLGIDWRIGAEWYECLLIDYDLSSNWGNWQYNAGVGNDPREARVFNPVKQAFDYDPKGDYVKMWVEELRGLDDLQMLFQPWKMDEDTRKERKLEESEMVREPLKRIDFHVKRGGNGGGRGRGGKGVWRGSSRGGGGGANGFSGRGRGEKFRGQSRRGKMDQARDMGVV